MSTVVPVKTFFKVTFFRLGIKLAHAAEESSKPGPFQKQAIVRQ